MQAGCVAPGVRGHGPFGRGQDDDQFGGPETDDAYRTGVIVRLDDDGGAPRDNPF